jgi:general secretion pathway protein J
MIIPGKSGSIRSQRGFTLLEIIIAITLVAMIAAGLWGVLSISIRSWSRGTQSIDTNQHHRAILDLLRKQIASAYALSAPVDPQTGGPNIPIFKGTENSVLFISLNSLQFHESPGLTLVSYEVTQNSREGYSLMEKEERYTGQDPADESLMDRRDVKPLTVFDGLLSFAFDYFEPGTDEKPGGWVKEWDGQDNGTLPTAIRMTMTARDPQGNKFNRYMVIPIKSEATAPRMVFTDSMRQRVGRALENEN